MSAATTPFYHTGGTLRPDAPSYVERKADQELYEGLIRGEYCYVLTSRQMGKSSLMNRTAVRLREAGAAVAVLDLTAIGQNLTVEQWYDGLLGRLGRSLDLEEELEGYWLAHERLSPLQRWMRALHEIVLARCPGRLVVFIDEIDAVRSLPFSTDEFFAAIRECYNRRTEEPDFARLCFCLLGVATPSDLIQDTRTTPFNIGRRIELTDFSAAEAAPLAAGLSPTPPPAPPLPGEGSRSPSTVPETRERRQAPPSLAGKGAGGLGPAERLLQRILHWTHGHPYLTQRLCQAVAAEATMADPAGVDRLCEELFFSPRARERDDNLIFVRERLLRGEAERASLLDLYTRVWQGQRVADDETSELVSFLRLSGITRSVDGCLRVRNRVYERVFDREWINTNMPDAELRRQQAAYRRGLLRAAAVFAAVLALIGGLAFTAMKQARLEKQRNLIARLAQEEKRLRYRYVYGGQMILARRAWESGALQRARDLLDAYRPAPGEEDLRGLEWRLLWPLCHHEESSSIWQIEGGYAVLSPDGRLLARSSNLNGLYNAANLELWDVATARQVATLPGGPDKASSILFSPDSRTLAVIPWQGHEVRIWGVASRHRIGTIGDINSLFALAFSPDSRTLIAGSQTNLHVWDVVARRPVTSLPRPGTGPLSIAFTPAGRLLSTSANNGTVEIWEPGRQRRVARFSGAGLPVRTLVFSPDRRLLAAAEPFAGRVRLWDISSQRLLNTFPVPPGNQVRLAFSPDGRRLAAGGGDFTLRVWDLATLAEENVFRGHGFWINAVAFTPDGRSLMSGGWDGKVRFWPLARRDSDLLRGEGETPWVLAFSPDGSRVVTGGVRGKVEVWDSATKRHLASLKAPNATDMISSVACSPDGRTLAVGSWDDTERLWDLTTRQVVYTFKKRRETDNHPVAFSPDGRTLALSGASNGSALVLWDVTTRREIARFHGHTSDIAGIAFTRDGRRVVTGCTDGTTRLWDIAGHREVRRFTGPSVYHVALSPDDRLLAMGGDRDLITVWDVETGQKVAALRGDTGEITYLQFSADGRTLISSDSAGPLHLWSTASWVETAAIQEPLRAYNALALSPDGNTLAQGRADGSVRLLHAAPWSETDRPQPIARAADRQVLLQWAPLPRALGYFIYRGPASAGASQIRKLTAQPQATTAYDDVSPELRNGQAETYAVSALTREADGRSVEGPRVKVTAMPVVVPAGWAGTSINEGQRSGSARFVAGEVVLRGSGADFWDTADGGYFLNQPMSGDFRITVQMGAGPTPSSEWAKAGLMLRESLEAGSREAHLVRTAAHGCQWQQRAAPNSTTDDHSDIASSKVKRPAVLRLTRQGDQITAEYSTDGGRSFQPAGDPVTFAPPLAKTVYAGVAITAHDASQISVARFRDLRIEPLGR